MKHKLRIETTNTGAKVYFDGKEISDSLRGYTIQHTANSIPVVKLEFIADVEYDGAEVELEDSDNEHSPD